MGWQDRDYGNDSYGSYSGGRLAAAGIRRPPTVTLTLMIVHGLAFVLVRMLLAAPEPAPPLAWANVGQHPAGIVLHPLATGRILSGLFVVLALWSLGGRLELKLGPKRLVQLYVVGNLIAGVGYFVLARVLPAMAGHPLEYPAGALAAMCVAAWMHLRGQPVNVFGRITNAGKMYAVCAAIVIGMQILGHRQDALLWVLAAGAGGTSALLVERWGRPGAFGFRRRRGVRPSISRPRRTARPDEPEIDDILAKISRAGLDSLTEEERQRLEAARRIKLERRE